MRKLRLLVFALIFVCCGSIPSAWSQMGVARAVAKTPGVPPTPCYAGAIRFNAANNTLYLCGPNSTWTTIATGGSAVGGSGTANQFAIFTAGTTIGNSILTQGTNLIEQKSTTNPQTFRVYGTTTNTGEILQLAALTSDSTTRVTSKILNAAATARPFEFGYENASATFLGWQVTTSGHLNPSSSNTATEIGSTNSPKILHLGGVGNGTAQIQMIGNTGGSGTLTVSIPDTVTTHTIKLPGTQGAASSVLTNDGSGGLSWAAASGGTAPIIPTASRYPVTSGLVMPIPFVGAGSGWKYFEGPIGVVDATTLNADATWALLFHMPPALPTGTAKLRLRCISALSSGALKFNPKWNMCGTAEDCSSVTLNAETTQTLTYTVAGAFVEVDTTLDASTVAAGKDLIMNLVFEDTNTTAAGNSSCDAFIVFIP